MSKQLEDYLNQLRSGLKELPENEREAEVEETRQHLLSLVEHRVEAGEEYEAAVAAAIQQFGEPRVTGKALRKVWWRGEAASGGRWAAVLHHVVAAGVVFQLLTGVVPLALLLKFYFENANNPEGPRIPLAFLLKFYTVGSLFQGNSFDTGWDLLWQLALSVFAFASWRSPHKLRLPFLGTLAVVGLFNVATVLPPGKFLTPLAVNYYLFSQLLCFAFSSLGVWLMVRSRTPRRALS